MGADKAVHLSDEALAGSDAVGTARALARAIGTVEDVDLVLAGNEASDGRSARGAGDGGRACWAARADPRARGHRRGRHGDGAAGDRRRRHGADGRAARGGVSVGEKINEPRYPSFKGIMAAKKKTVDHPVAGRRRGRRRRGRRGRRAHLGGVGVAEAAQERGREGRRRRRRRRRRSPRSWSPRSSSETDGERSWLRCWSSSTTSRVRSRRRTFELLTAARALGEPSAVVVGGPGTAAKLADGLREHGAEKVYVAETDSRRVPVPAGRRAGRAGRGGWTRRRC